VMGEGTLRAYVLGASCNTFMVVVAGQVHSVHTHFRKNLPQIRLSCRIESYAIPCLPLESDPSTSPQTERFSLGQPKHQTHDPHRNCCRLHFCVLLSALASAPPPLLKAWYTEIASEKDARMQTYKTRKNSATNINTQSSYPLWRLT
jgi:hypothetical protein